MTIRIIKLIKHYVLVALIAAVFSFTAYNAVCYAAFKPTAASCKALTKIFTLDDANKFNKKSSGSSGRNYTTDKDNSESAYGIIRYGDINVALSDKEEACVKTGWINITEPNKPDEYHKLYSVLLYNDANAEQHNTNVTYVTCAKMNDNKDRLAYINYQTDDHRIQSPAAQACITKGFCANTEKHDGVRPYLDCSVAHWLMECKNFNKQPYDDNLPQAKWADGSVDKQQLCIDNKLCYVDDDDNDRIMHCDKAKKDLDKAAKGDKNRDKATKQAESGDISVNSLDHSVPTQNNAQDACKDNSLDFGWIICPGVNILTKAIDGVASIVAGSLKWTIIADDAQNGNNLIAIWKKIRNIANIALVIAFIIALYSYATSAGNAFRAYTLKNLLSRLILVAIAIHISFYICAAAADVSNIIGNSIYELITSKMTSTGGDFATSLINTFQVITGVVAVVVLVALNFSTILTTVVLILAIIMLRQVALITLLLFSPIAFACYLLPNTEKWFKKWWDAYFKLLIVFPFFTTAWGASRLISNVMTLSGHSNVVVITVCSIAPLLAIMPIFQMTGAMMGKLTAMAQGAANKSGMNKLAQTADANRKKRIGNNIKSGSIKLQNRLNKGGAISRFTGNTIGRLNGTNNEAIQKRRDDAFDSTVEQVSSRYTKKMTDAANERINGVNGEGAMSDEDVMSVISTGKTKGGEQLNQYEQAAAIRRANRNGMINESNFQDIVKNAQNSDSKTVRQAVAESNYGRYMLGSGNEYNDFIKQKGHWKHDSKQDESGESKSVNMSDSDINEAINKSIRAQNISPDDMSNMSQEQRDFIKNHGG